MVSNSRSGSGIKSTRKKTMGFNFMAVALIVYYFFCVLPICILAAEQSDPKETQKLRFDENGEFKILQVADMHYANGNSTLCLDVLPSQNASCSDLNTTAFVQRMILAEKPNLIVFTGHPLLYLCFLVASCFWFVGRISVLSYFLVKHSISNSEIPIIEEFDDRNES